HVLSICNSNFFARGDVLFFILHKNRKPSDRFRFATRSANNFQHIPQRSIELRRETVRHFAFLIPADLASVKQHLCSNRQHAVVVAARLHQSRRIDLLHSVSPPQSEIACPFTAGVSIRNFTAAATSRGSTKRP